MLMAIIPALLHPDLRAKHIFIFFGVNFEVLQQDFDVFTDVICGKIHFYI